MTSSVEADIQWMESVMPKSPGQQEFAQPPVNVRIEHSDGTHTPVECVYSGYNKGAHHWNTVHEVILVRGDHKAWDQMPADTEVHLYVRGAV